MCNTYCFSIATVVERMGLNVTLYVHWLVILFINIWLSTCYTTVTPVSHYINPRWNLGYLCDISGCQSNTEKFCHINWFSVTIILFSVCAHYVDHSCFQLTRSCPLSTLRSRFCSLYPIPSVVFHKILHLIHPSPLSGHILLILLSYIK